MLTCNNAKQEASQSRINKDNNDLQNILNPGRAVQRKKKVCERWDYFETIKSKNEHFISIIYNKK